ncbi:interferon alpha-inducible protein 27-like protein 2 isoform X1 [Haliotis rufescens]|uniref:interferon alpha-inducible protein 27-like protein 2 isoform X1 n=1 Tax=Haliotis rufescens TaxID=6454 RepID=UPI001EB09D08|nr:interferon alpha-inducible protein 27-like protein 2 isoform X1 [Haliotis rufescens]
MHEDCPVCPGIISSHKPVTSQASRKEVLDRKDVYVSPRPKRGVGPCSIMPSMKDVAIPTVVGLGAFLAAPYVLSAIGFTSAGIAAGSVGTKAMSFAWTTGWGVGAVSSLQSAGAAGIGLASKALIGGTAAVCANKARGN